MKHFNVPENVKRKPTRVIYMPNRIGKGKYYGMNYPAHLKLKDSEFPKMSKNEAKRTVLVYDKQNPFRKEEDLRHEIGEKTLINGGFSYPEAHRAMNILQSERDFVIVRGSQNRRGSIRRRI